ncbi:MAG: hydratase [Cyanobacteria bacterium P01_F01_bin.150]
MAAKPTFVKAKFILLGLTMALLLSPQTIRALPEQDRAQAEHAERTDDALQVQSIANYFRSRLPIPHSMSPATEVSEAQAIAYAEYQRDHFILDLLPEFGPIVGYKAALTSPPAQARFGISQPLRGTLLHHMLLDSGATIPSNFGARPLFEPDLMVRVGSAAINNATTRPEALAALKSVIPFIELPDMMFASDVELGVTDLIAVNVGARLGVMGKEVPLHPSALSPHPDGQDWVDGLGNIEVTIMAGSADEIDQGGGEAIASGNSQALLGHPLDAVLWLVKDLKRSGQCLRPGDLLSLGSITAPMPVVPGQTIEARYQGLAEDINTVQITFEPLP